MFKKSSDMFSTRKGHKQSSCDQPVLGGNKAGILLLFYLMLSIPGVGYTQSGKTRPLQAVKLDTIKAETGEHLLVETGRLELPENRLKANGRKISIAYYRVRSTNPSPSSPVFLLAGGPGSSWMNSVHKAERFKEIKFYQAYADVVIFDQRGAGRSIPNLACEGRKNINQNLPFSFELLKPAIQELALACRTHWEKEGVDLSAYNTDENAADVNALRAAMGYRKITLIGGSYGSHLGLHIMRKFPAIVDRAVFYGIEGPDHTWDNPSGRLATLQRIAAAAATDPYYEGKIPAIGLLGALAATLERLERKPVTVQLEHRGQTYEVLVNKEVVQAIADYRAGKRSQPELWPNTILAMYNGDLSLPARAAMGMRSIPSPDAMGNAMDFASGVSSSRKEKIESDPARKLLGDINWDYTAMENTWGVKDLGDEFRKNIVSDIPTLLVHGTWDTSTPIENAHEVLAALKNGHLLEVIGGTHGALYNLYEHWPKIYPLLARFIQAKKVKFPKRVDLGSPTFPTIAVKAQAKLWEAAKLGDTLGLEKALLEGAAINALDTRRSKNGRRALNWAAYNNHVSALKVLLKHGADIDATNLSGFTPLHHAVENKAIEAARYLIEQGADKSISSKSGRTPLQTAQGMGQRELIGLLLGTER